MRSVERERNWHNRAARRTQVLFEQRVARGFEHESLALVNLWDGAVEPLEEDSLGVDEVQLGHGARGLLDGGQLSAQLLGQRREDSENLALLRLAQRLQLVVRFNRLQGLDEDGRARGGEAVRDALDAAAVV